MITVTSATDRYHHGDLPNALLRAAVEVIEERGLGAFSQREVARRAGVSHNAPAHHFGDTRGLLTSLAIQGFEVLHAATTAVASPIFIKTMATALPGATAATPVLSTMRAIS